MSKTKSFDERRGVSRRPAGINSHPLPALRPVPTVSRALKTNTGIDDRWTHDLYRSRDGHRDPRPSIGPQSKPPNPVNVHFRSGSESSPLKTRADSPVDMTIPPHLRSRQTSAMSVDEVEPAKEGIHATQTSVPRNDSPQREDTGTPRVEALNGFAVAESLPHQSTPTKQAEITQCTSDIQAEGPVARKDSCSHESSEQADLSMSTRLQKLEAEHAELRERFQKAEVAFTSVNERCNSMQKENEHYQFELNEKFEALFLAEERRQLGGTRHAPFDVEGQRLRIQAYGALKIADLARRAAVAHRLSARESLSARILSKDHEKLDVGATMEECGLAADANLLYLKEESVQK